MNDTVQPAASCTSEVSNGPTGSPGATTNTAPGARDQLRPPTVSEPRARSKYTSTGNSWACSPTLVSCGVSESNAQMPTGGSPDAGTTA